MRVLLILAGKEIRDAFRNRWVVCMVVVFAGLAALLTLIGSAPTGTVKAAPLEVAVASVSSLSVYLVPLIALMVAYDAIVGEFERGTALLLLAYPVARWQVVLGKFLGHAAVLTLALGLGFGLPAAIVAFGAGGAAGWQAYLAMTASAALLGWVFLALGYVISVLCSERATAAGLAIAVWLLLVVLYDLALLGLLIADGGAGLGPSLFTAVLVTNPTDAYRLLAISGSEAVALAVGIGDLARPQSAVLLSVLAVWLIVPLVAAVVVFQRKEL